MFKSPATWIAALMVLLLLQLLIDELMEESPPAHSTIEDTAQKDCFSMMQPLGPDGTMILLPFCRDKETKTPRR